jgi:hypothetical protein
MLRAGAFISLLALVSIVRAEEFVAWNIPYDKNVPGVVSAESLLDAPAGRAGFVTVRGDHFYCGERRIRFWGTNFCFGACFPTHEEADKLALRLARFGINAVRFHHMDNAPFPRGIFTDAKLDTLSPEAMDRLDYFISALKSQGIYSDLNLHVSRTWSRAHDWPNAAKLPAFDKIVDLYHPDLIAADKQFARDLLTHLNAYTKNRYADEPAICFVEINNENTFFTWGGEETIGNLPQPYKKMLLDRWKAWLAKEYPKGESPSRNDDWYRFLQETEEAHYTSMRDFLRKDLGAKMPITGTIALGMLGQLTQSRMDFVDGHRYWDHPTFPRRQWDPEDWRIENKSVIDAPQRMTFRLALDRVHGKPFTVTEFNHAAPNDFQAEGIPMIASYAAMQDWDAVFLFASSHNNDYQKDAIDGFFNIEGNPLKMAAMPIAARMFLSGAIAPIAEEKILRPTMTQIVRTAPLFYQDISGFAFKQMGVTNDDLLHRRISIEFGASASSTSPSTGGADTRIQWKDRQFIFRDDHAAVFAGFANGKPIDLPGFQISNLKSLYAVVAIAPANPADTLDKADRILVYFAGRAENTGQHWNDTRTSVGTDWGTGPVLIEPIRATVQLTRSSSQLIPLNPDGSRAAPITGHDGICDIGQTPSLWYEILAKQPSP